MYLPDGNRSRGPRFAVVLLCLTAGLTGCSCISEGEHNKQMAAQSQKHAMAILLMSAEHGSEIAAKNEEMIRLQKTADEKMKHKEEELARLREEAVEKDRQRTAELIRQEAAAGEKLKQKEEELGRARREKGKAVEAAWWKGYGDAIARRPAFAMIALPSRQIETMILASLWAMCGLLAAAIVGLVWARTPRLILGRALTCLIGLYACVLLQSISPAAGDVMLRQSILRPGLVVGALLVAGWTVSHFFILQLRDDGRPWLRCLAIAISTLALLQCLVLALAPLHFTIALKPFTALQILAAPLAGAAMYFVHRLCSGAKPAEKQASRKSWEWERLKFTSPVESILNK